MYCISAHGSVRNTLSPCLVLVVYFMKSVTNFMIIKSHLRYSLDSKYAHQPKMQMEQQMVYKQCGLGIDNAIAYFPSFSKSHGNEKLECLSNWSMWSFSFLLPKVAGYDDLWTPPLYYFILILCCNCKAVGCFWYCLCSDCLNDVARLWLANNIWIHCRRPQRYWF